MASETSRIEAFSDGVYAIAITLLILDLKVLFGGDGDQPGSWRPKLLAFQNRNTT